jgi:hypothetical protein
MQYLFAKHRFKVLAFYTYSRKDPASNGSLMAKVFHRWLKLGSNLTFIVSPE